MTNAYKFFAKKGISINEESNPVIVLCKFAN